MPDYLAEGFDPNSLKMAQLRSLLFQHDVHPSSTARKADLVAEFNRHIAPLAPELRSRNNTVVASSSGIIDLRAQRTDDSSADDSPAKAPRRGLPSLAARTSTAASRNEPETSAAQPAQVAEAPVKRPRGRPRKSAPATVAASRQSPTKEVSFDVQEQSGSKRSEDRSGRDESGFSDYNPFQSGSEASPEVGPAAKAAAAARRARRKTMGEPSSRLAMRSDDDEDDEDKDKDEDRDRAPIRKASSKKAAVPRSSTVPALKNYMDPSVIAATPPRIIGDALKRGRELFSPSRSLGPEDENQDAAFAVGNGKVKHEDESKWGSESSRRTSKRYAYEDLTTSQKSSQLLWVILVGVVAFWALWYTRESRTIGYCDTGSTTNSLLIQRELEAQAAAAASRAALAEGQQHDDDDDESALAGQIVPDFLRPTCTPCPDNAVCKDTRLLGCISPDYVVEHAWLDNVPLSGLLLPLGWVRPSCVPDTAKLVLAADLASSINIRLAKWKGEVVCGKQGPHASVAALVKKGSRPELRYALPEPLVRQVMFDSRDRGRVSEELFEQLWDLAMEDVVDSDGNVIRIASNSSDPALAMAEPLLAARAPILSIGCRSRLAVRALIERTWIYAALLASALIAGSVLSRRRKAMRDEKRKVTELVQVALERLQEQDHLHSVDPVSHPESAMPTSHLRDHVLRSEHSRSARQRLWKKVANIVEENSNVRTNEVKWRGEYQRVWEWVGVAGVGVGAGTSQAGTPAQKRLYPSQDKRSRRSLAVAASMDDGDVDDELKQLAYEVDDSPLKAR
ncbi:uncharacterized protein PFL1_00453 [Pseudozyma flocculosa PF-1]|uniref:uncharacterized protein n=1 Tax=Pseudozyma flocculosa PF-1 TaxID=1277687 RepID=UPI00045614C5|nr:uncharacterized protein PFL1_00453 [Pseudozyma flocculosa PF-1]EPQ32256.1 hypothetical protein PFL1_00453 [Pseudozyma flocculosa PF-1]